MFSNIKVDIFTGQNSNSQIILQLKGSVKKWINNFLPVSGTSSATLLIFYIGHIIGKKIHYLTRPVNLMVKDFLYQVINFLSYIKLKYIFHSAYFLIDPDSIFRRLTGQVYFLLYTAFLYILKQMRISLSQVLLVT